MRTGTPEKRANQKKKHLGVSCLGAPPKWRCVRFGFPFQAARKRSSLGTAVASVQQSPEDFMKTAPESPKFKATASEEPRPKRKKADSVPVPGAVASPGQVFVKRLS